MHSTLAALSSALILLVNVTGCASTVDSGEDANLEDGLAVEQAAVATLLASNSETQGCTPLSNSALYVPLGEGRAQSFRVAAQARLGSIALRLKPSGTLPPQPPYTDPIV